MSDARAMRTLSWLVLCSSLSLGAACQSSRSSSGPGEPEPSPDASTKTAPAEGAGAPVATLPDRDPELAHRLVAEGALLLDVRTPQEFALGHLEGARNVSHEQVPHRLDEIRQWAGDGPVVVYCRSGRRSGIAKEALVEAGIVQVTNLGGMSDW